MQTLLLEHSGAPEDDILMTVIPREIHRHYPGKFRVMVKSNNAGIWYRNPTATSIPTEAAVGSIEPSIISVPGRPRKRQHILQAYLDAAVTALRPYGITSLPLTELKPSIYLDTAEMKNTPSHDGVTQGIPYWLICAGWDTKRSIYAWDATNWQQVVSYLAMNTQYLAVYFGSSEEFTTLPRFKFGVDLCDSATLREVVWMMHNARGVICTPGQYPHIAAALGKPCIVIAGDIRPRWYESYSMEMIKRYAPAVDDKYEPLARSLVAHKYIGGFETCKTKGHECYGVNMLKDCDNITQPNPANLQSPRMQQASCMADITYHQVIKAIKMYEEKMGEAGYDQRIINSRDEIVDADDVPGAILAAVGE